MINALFILLHCEGPAASPETAAHPAKHGKDHGAPVAAPSNVSHHHSMPANIVHGKTHATPVVVPEKRRHHHLPANITNVKGILPGTNRT
jgi:hypothetical protein